MRFVSHHAVRFCFAAVDGALPADYRPFRGRTRRGEPCFPRPRSSQQHICKRSSGRSRTDPAQSCGSLKLPTRQFLSIQKQDVRSLSRPRSGSRHATQPRWCRPPEQYAVADHGSSKGKGQVGVSAAGRSEYCFLMDHLENNKLTAHIYSHMPVNLRHADNSSQNSRLVGCIQSCEGRP